MRFEDDVFISYRHLNNQLKDDKGKGWVDNFHERLECTLADLLPHEPKIWRDTRMPGNVYIAGHLQQKLRQTKVFVSILSPGYVNSAWCMGELSEFCRLAAESGGLEIEGKLRVFKVVKLPFSGQEPEPLKNQAGYAFYAIHQASQEPEEFAQELGPNKDKRYWDILMRLACAIRNVLACYREGLPIPVATSPFAPAALRASKGAVYLAETTSDRRDDRESIKDQLEQLQYEVLPDKLLPSVSPAYEQAVAAYLRRAKLSVHLLGSRYAGTPEGASSTVAQLQLELAIQHRDDPAFTRLIWRPANLEVTDPRQQDFIQALQTDSKWHEYAELRVELLEDLKTFILKKLEPPPPPPPGKKPAATTTAGHGDTSNGGPVSVYLVYDADDHDEAIAVEEYLFNQGYEVVSSLNWLPQTHERNLTLCDSLLVYHRNSNSAWLNERRTDLLQARGLREGRRFYAQAFYLSAPPETPIKSRFRSNDALVLRSSNGFDSSKLAEFFDKIHRAKGTAP